MSKKLTTKEFIQKAKEIHGNKYDYSLVEYKNSNIKVKIICPKHGVFEQIPKNHLRGFGCYKCGKNSTDLKNSFTTKEFIRRAKEIHRDRYDYSLIEYKNNRIKVKIICPKHGIFEQTPKIHLKGSGCPECGKLKKNNKLSNKEIFIEKAKKIYGSKYNYSLVDYKNLKTKIKIICPKHGVFEQIPFKFLSGKECPKCRKEQKRNEILIKNIEKAKQIHDNKYDYSLVEFNKTTEKVKIICPEHGIFEQMFHNHVSGRGCPKCSYNISKYENEIYKFLKSYNINVIQGYRGWAKTNNNFEIDLYLPEYRIGIEFNGARWHSTLFNDDKFRHQKKMLLAIENGIDLISIPSFLWKEKSDIIKKIILNRLNKNENRIYARKCVIKNVDKKTMNFFCEQHHIHGHRVASIVYGLFHNNEIVALMSFIKKKNNEYEIARYVTSCGVIGGFSKLFKYFVKKHKPKCVISFADAQFWTGCSYRSVGFVIEYLTEPNYCYVDEHGNYVGSRQQFQKHKLKNKLQFFDENLTESENCAKNGLYQYYDCGHWKWVWKTT